MKAIYLHIPFCEQICHYCDFSKVFIENQPVDRYLQALEREVELTLDKHPQLEGIQSIFIGGGTPTALNHEQLSKLLRFIEKTLLPLASDELEYTIEANPNDLNQPTLELLKQGGANRLSIGQQAFQSELLERLGRTHGPDTLDQVIPIARNVGFTNLSVDLMFGLPGQTQADWENSLKRATSLGIEHVSAYSLIIEPKTVFYNLHKRGRLPLPVEDEDAKMYESLIVHMQNEGLMQYEISNFARPGFESKHNLTYWDNEEYIGAGAGAHGYIDGYRTVNTRPIGKYIDAVEAGQPHLEHHLVTTQEKMEEELFLGLRKNDGVSLPHFVKKFGMPLPKAFMETIQQLKTKELLSEEDGQLRLTELGRPLGNEVFQAFLGLEVN